MLSVDVTPKVHGMCSVPKHGDNLSTTNQWGPMVTHNTVLKAAHVPHPWAPQTHRNR